MGGEGIAPTRSNATGFTDPPAYFNGLAAHIKMTLSQSTAHLLIAGTFALPIVAYYSRYYTLEGVGAKGEIRTRDCGVI